MTETRVARTYRITRARIVETFGRWALITNDASAVSELYR